MMADRTVCANWHPIRRFCGIGWFRPLSDVRFWPPKADIEIAPMDVRIWGVKQASQTGIHEADITRSLIASFSRD
jgi:hypothetical protein